ncbi:MAG: hypothetical protein P4L56_29240 [Candidatus Sulfopaludibacter sp.]|nr:hypothetical protein [Candidatus Sulfopaludibacter sp.]
MQLQSTPRRRGSRGLDGHAGVRAVKVFVNRKERERLELGEGPAQFLFYSVNLVEKGAAIDIQTPATQIPICSQKEMEAEEPVFGLVQRSSRDQAKISHEFFAFPRV